MIHIVADVNVFTKKLLPDPVCQAASALIDRKPAKIEEQETQQVEDRGVFKNYNVSARLNIFRFPVFERLARSTVSKNFRLKLHAGRRSLLGPARASILHHGYRKFRTCLLVKRFETPGIKQRRH